MKLSIDVNKLTMSIAMIADKDISIVVQGPILTDACFGITTELTKTVCHRLKQLFPESELILSTWEGEKVAGIPCDTLILNKDPGATWFDYNHKEHLNNCNRLIISTLHGIKAATRPYVLKVRSDLFLVSKNFLKYFNRFPWYEEHYQFVKSRIICFSLNTLYGHKTCLFTMERPFHISDWAYFGYKEDLIKLYDIPLTEEPEFSQWFLTRCKPFHDIEPERLWKMPPEQYITSSFFKKFIPIHLEHTADTTNNNMFLSSKLITNNFLVLDQTQFCLVSLKYLYFSFSSWKGYENYIYHSDWLKDYCHCKTPIALEQKMKYSLQIVIRGSLYALGNKILRFLNGKNQYLCRLGAYLLKRKISSLPLDQKTFKEYL